jgi:hypothetical protein
MEPKRLSALSRITLAPAARCRLLLASVALLLAQPLNTSAQAQKAQKAPHTEDLIVFAQEGALWTLSAASQTPERLLDLPFAAEDVEEIRISSNGSALLLNAGGFVAWSPLGAEEGRKFQLLPCSGPSNISADGDRVVCGTQDARRIAVYTLRPALAVEIVDRKAVGPLYFAESKGDLLTFGDNDDLITVGNGGTRVVASHRPHSTMAVTPDGQRAIGAYSEDAIDVVYSFRLDGKASKRTLVHAAKAIRASADSKWVAVQQEVDGCAVRIAGGQYMCWREYKALAISSEGRSLLLSRRRAGNRDLFLGAVTGTSAKKPLPLIEGVGAAAAFWRRPLLADESMPGAAGGSL